MKNQPTTINFRLDPKDHTEICKRVGKKMVETGKPYSLSDWVRELVARELSK